MTQNKIVVDCATGGTTMVALTEQEIAERDQQAAQYAEQQAEKEAQAEALQALKASAKAKLIAGQALTDEEASAIVI
jgi:hypothetical protein